MGCQGHLHKGGITAVSYVMPSKNASCNFCPYRILRPNTSCLVLAIDSTILSGGLFYRISNIIQSCIGALQSFLIASNSYQPGVFKTSRLLLSRILIYIHQQFVQEGITTGNTTTDAGHDGGYSQCFISDKPSRTWERPPPRHIPGWCRSTRA